MTHPAQHHPDPRLDHQFYDGVPFKRLLAWGMDVVAVLAISLGLVIGTLGFFAFFFPFVLFIVNLLYRVFSIQKWSATPGMRIAGIELRNTSGDRFSQSDTIWHTGIYIFLFMSVLGIFANALSIMLSVRGQGLHDLLLNTIAINRPQD